MNIPKRNWQSLQGSKIHVIKEKTHSFGQSIFTDQNYLYVGADDTPLNGTYNEGCVYVFNKQTLEEKKILYNKKTLPNSFYGWSVLKCENDICIGIDDDDLVIESLGSVDVFDKNFEFKQKIVPPLRKVKSYFGFSLASLGNILMVGAPAYRSGHYGHIPNEAKNGLVYIYKDYHLEQILTNEEHSFGWSIDLSSDYYFSSTPSGRVFLYSHDKALLDIYEELPSVKKIKFFQGRLYVSTQGEGVYIFDVQDRKFNVVHQVNVSGGGYCFDVNDKYIVLSDVENDDLEYMNLKDENHRKGKIYVYDHQYRLIDTIINEDIKNLGHCLHLDDRDLYIGVPGYDNNQGILLKLEL